MRIIIIALCVSVYSNGPQFTDADARRLLDEVENTADMTNVFQNDIFQDSSHGHSSQRANVLNFLESKLQTRNFNTRNFDSSIFQ